MQRLIITDGSSSSRSAMWLNHRSPSTAGLGLDVIWSVSRPVTRIVKSATMASSSAARRENIEPASADSATPLSAITKSLGQGSARTPRESRSPSFDTVHERARSNRDEGTGRSAAVVLSRPIALSRRSILSTARCAERSYCAALGPLRVNNAALSMAVSRNAVALSSGVEEVNAPGTRHSVPTPLTNAHAAASSRVASCRTSSGSGRTPCAGDKAVATNNASAGLTRSAAKAIFESVPDPRSGRRAPQSSVATAALNASGPAHSPLKQRSAVAVMSIRRKMIADRTHRRSGGSDCLPHGQTRRGSVQKERSDTQLLWVRPSHAVRVFGSLTWVRLPRDVATRQAASRRRHDEQLRVRP